MWGIIISIVLFIITIPLKTTMLALKAAGTTVRVGSRAVQYGSSALQKAGIGNDEVGKVIRGGEAVAHGVASTGRATINAGKNAVKATKTAVKIGKVAVETTIKAIKALISLIKFVITIIASCEVVMIVCVVLLAFVLIASIAGVVMTYINGGEFTWASSGSGGGQNTQSEYDNSSYWNCCVTMFDWYVDNMPFELHGYSNSHGASDCRYSVNANTYSTECDILNNAKVGTYCSGYVQAVICYAGLYDYEGTAQLGWDSCATAVGYLSNYKSSGSSGHGFTDEVMNYFDLYTYSDYESGAYKPQKGDIVIKNGHMEIYGGLSSNNTVYKLTWGESFYREGDTCVSGHDLSDRVLARGEFCDTGNSESTYLAKYTYYLQYKGGSVDTTETTTEESTTEESTTE